MENNDLAPAGNIRVIVTDDNEPFVRYMIELLEPFPFISVVGSAFNAADLMVLAAAEKPDALFLDVQMPGENGFEIARRLYDIKPDLDIVYITAFPELAIQGFEVGACDYLSKPVTLENLERSITRLCKSQRRKTQELAASLQNEIITVKDLSGTRLIKMHSIEYIEKIGHLSVINGLDGPVNVRESLDSLDRRLKAYFFRTHRGFIVNLNRVKLILPLNGSSYELQFGFSPGTALLSKKKYPEFLGLIRDLR